MAHRRAVYAARFLRPPGWTKRLLLREKPRELTGPFENPVRRWVRLREKARQFAELPMPRKVPVPKPAKDKPLQAVEGVPKVDPEVLMRRLEFLLSPAAVEQQLAAPLRPGLSPYFVEFTCWERQMREIRRVYRAQYLQKLTEVTEIERQKEAELKRREKEERRRRKQAHLQRVGEDMKRRAILKDRKRIEAKVNEAIEMARRSKVKRHRLFWFRRMENLSKLIVSSENFDQVFPTVTTLPGQQAKGSTDTIANNALKSSGVLLSRNVSVPFLLRQLGGAKGYPKQHGRRIPHVDNVQRELLELSYDELPEDEPRFEPAPTPGLGPRERAAALYGGMSETEKLALLDQKIQMLQRKEEFAVQKGAGLSQTDQKLLEMLRATKMAATEQSVADELKASQKASRGPDPPGLEPPFGARPASATGRGGAGGSGQ